VNKDKLTSDFLSSISKQSFLLNFNLDSISVRIDLNWPWNINVRLDYEGILFDSKVSTFLL
jgi:hypothetical protein